jgi:hypothetical protein
MASEIPYHERGEGMFTWEGDAAVVYDGEWGVQDIFEGKYQRSSLRLIMCAGRSEKADISNVIISSFVNVCGENTI